VVYKDLAEDEGYSWFVDLIPRTIFNSKLIILVDNDNKEVNLDLEFNQIEQITSLEEMLDDENQIFDEDFKLNRIVFGAPGTGKSFRLEKDKEKFRGNYERVTFHPNYSYSQFVGTYKPVPVKDENGEKTDMITYEYVPGPFMRTFVKAVNSQEPYLLLIEEINRANVTAVFGDVFQLLDRKDGESEYPIETSEDMRDYLEEAIKIEDFDCERIKIPSNMYIWATMNSADQGVFPMDTAFKRRWDFEYIGIDDEQEEIKNVKFMACQDDKKNQEGHSVCWNDLRKAINDRLSNDCKINEDKLLGPYFLSNELLKTKKDTNFVEDNDGFLNAFKSKVLMYLFEDAAKQKQHRQKLFKGCDSSTITYSSICAAFDEKGEGLFGEDILPKGEE
jgi:5-methylcytosine-specific restriction endonuclease McrBC GTP-binding regulatory subunit McrB